MESSAGLAETLGVGAGRRRRRNRGRPDARRAATTDPNGRGAPRRRAGPRPGHHQAQGSVQGRRGVGAAGPLLALEARALRIGLRGGRHDVRSGGPGHRSAGLGAGRRSRAGRATATPSRSQASRPCTVRVSSTTPGAHGPAHMVVDHRTHRDRPAPRSAAAAAPATPEDLRGSGPVPCAGPRPPRPGAGTRLRRGSTAGERSGRPPAPSWPAIAATQFPARLARLARLARWLRHGAREAREARSACLSLPAGGLSTGRLRWTGRSGSLSRGGGRGYTARIARTVLPPTPVLTTSKRWARCWTIARPRPAFGVGVHQADPGGRGCRHGPRRSPRRPVPAAAAGAARTAVPDGVGDELRSDERGVVDLVGGRRRRPRTRTGQERRGQPAGPACRNGRARQGDSTRAVSRTAPVRTHDTTSPPRTTGTRRPHPRRPGPAHMVRGRSCLRVMPAPGDRQPGAEVTKPPRMYRVAGGSRQSCPGFTARCRGGGSPRSRSRGPPRS